MSWSGIFDVAVFLLSAGFQAAVWTVVFAVGGLVVGLILTVLWHRWLLRIVGKQGGFAVVAFTFLTLAFWWVSVPLLSTGAGAIIGAAVGAQKVVMRDEVLRPATGLAFAAARSALRATAPPEGMAEEHALALALAEGETTYQIDEIDGLLDRFSEDALVRARGAIEKLTFTDGNNSEPGSDGNSDASSDGNGSGAAVTEETPRGAGRIAGMLAKGGTERLIDFLIERQRDATRKRWLTPVIENLRSTDPEGDEQVTGPQIGHSIARAHLQRPLARAALLGIGLEAVLAVGLVVLVLFFPLPVALAIRMSRRSGQTETRAESPTPTQQT